VDPAAGLAGAARQAVARLSPAARLFTELVAALTEVSPQFRAWWDEYPVQYFRPASVRIAHPRAGRITLEMFQLRLEDDPGHLMVVQVPADPESLDRIAALLGTAG